MELTGVAALVTGAASGLGAATAHRLAELGASVYGLDLEQAIERTDASGVRLIAADVTDEQSVQAALLEVARGGRPLRVLVNCAGIVPSRRILNRSGPHELALFQQVMDVNVVGTFNVLRLAAEVMAATEPTDEHGQRGVIINTASIAAFEAQIGHAAYAASKAAVVGLTLAAARDLAQVGIRVLTIAPGVVDTAMLASLRPEARAGLAETVPFPRRLAAPSEFAHLVGVLIENDYLNGETIRMDGALRMAPC